MSHETSLVVVFIASLLAGAQNALAGGGSFVTLPALLLAGLDPRGPNVHWGAVALACLAAPIGGLAGAWLLRRVPERLLHGSIVLVGAGLTVGLFLRPIRAVLPETSNRNMQAIARRRRERHPAAMLQPDRETLLLSTGPTQVLWRRSARARKISLRIDASAGGVIVTLPPRAALAAGMALLRDNAAWVAERLARLPDRVVLADGVAIPIDGLPHCIRHVPRSRGVAWLESGELRISGAPEFLARRASDFLRATAGRRFSALALAKAAAAGLSPRRIVVKDTRTRWGSCTADGTLMFCWRLILAPPHVQDYVVAHEVAHLRHMDHGRGFWALVAQLTPNKPIAMAWLDAHGPGLMRIGAPSR